MKPRRIVYTCPHRPRGWVFSLLRPYSKEKVWAQVCERRECVAAAAERVHSLTFNEVKYARMRRGR